MSRCLQLASSGLGLTAPNPVVGAVLIYNDEIIGEGYHEKYGQAHAEVNCINSVTEGNKHLIERSTMYVSLEPCAHYGKTPPCADLIIRTKIPNVVIGCRDVFKEGNGKGIEKLESAGVNVTTGILEKECILINKRFFTFHQKARPYIILKWAQSIDAKMGAPGPHFSKERTLISNEYTNRLVHKWRSEEAAIMVGTNTALYDDPLLTTRLWQGRNPVRIVIDLRLQLPASQNIFNREVKTIIFNNIKHEEEKDLVFYRLEQGDGLQQIVKTIFDLNIQSILVEGGATLLQSFINEGLWDEAKIISNDKLILGTGIKAPGLSGAVFQKTERYSDNSVSYFLNQSV